MSNLLLKFFVKNYNDINDNNVRKEYINLGAGAGIAINIFLFLLKFIIGFISNSIAITADAFNNLSDATSSVIAIIGFKIASKPADKEHPFGHGRMEYLTSLFVCCMIVVIALEFAKTSFNRIQNPSIIKFELITFILLLISIVAKLWLSKFTKEIGIKIKYNVLIAAAQDAFLDAIITSTVVISYIASKFTTLPIDGYMGTIVSIGILISGVKTIKDTISPLLGEPPSKELVNNITNEILKYKYILGFHDLIIHNYGPQRIMCTVHVEVSSDNDIITIHNIIDKMEREISKKLNIHLVIHMDPVILNNNEVLKYKTLVTSVVNKYKEIQSMHDFRIVDNIDSKNLIFDIVVKYSDIKNKDDIKKLIDSISNDILLEDSTCNCIIEVDFDYL